MINRVKYQLVKTLLGLGMFLGSGQLLAQVPGSVAKSTTSTVTATAGGVVCVFKSQMPQLPTGVAIECKAGVSVLSQTTVVAVGSPSGVVGSFNVGVDAVTWIITQPTAGVVNWAVAANGANQTGTF